MLSRFSCVPTLCVPTLWTVTHQAPLPLEFSRQEYWSGLPRPPPGDFCDPGIKPVSAALQADSLVKSRVHRLCLQRASNYLGLCGPNSHNRTTELCHCLKVAVDSTYKSG